MRVDFPRPDSPVDKTDPPTWSGERIARVSGGSPLPGPTTGPLSKTHQTCYHECEVKTLLDGLAVQLVGEGGEPHILLVLLVGGHTV